MTPAWARSRLKVRAHQGWIGHAPRPGQLWIAMPLAIAVASALGWALYQGLPVSQAVLGTSLGVVTPTLALMVALAAVLARVYTHRKQRLSDADAAGTDPDQLSQRYSTAAEQLGSDKVAARLAGVSAMARLADDSPTQRQQCIDVLCGYLRKPAEPDAGISEGDVRAAVVRSISAHLRDQSAISWVNHDFDFTGATFYDADFADVTFSGGRTSFAGATFSGGVTRFAKATFSGKMTRFDGATFSGGVARFDGATFSGKNTIFAGTTFSGWHTIFDGATFSGASVIFAGATFSGWYTNFDGATFSGWYTNFDAATFSAKQTGFDAATFSGQVIRFEGATFSGKQTGFDGATFSGMTTADGATTKASFVGSAVSWGPISARSLPSPQAGTVSHPLPTTVS